jgi:predicted AAA+ superfamily ATPase
MYSRHLLASLREALADTPVVLLNGARQTGKSTLVRQLAADEFPARYLTLDDATVLSAAQTAAEDFVAGLGGPVVLDEVQRAPELFLALKAAVDRERRPGRFLLTGSADVMMLPRVAESLAGRIEVLTLWPLSQGEIEGVREGFVDALFSGRAGKLPAVAGLARDELVARVLAGGYPEVLARPAGRRRRAWFGSYVTSILQRDVRDIANIEGLAELPRLLALLAARTSALLNASELSRGSGIPLSTLKRYLALLEATFLVQPLPAWSGNLGKRLTKSPKLLLTDTGLAAYLLGLDAAQSDDLPSLFGSLLENFVAMEVRKQAAWSETQPRLYHFRVQGEQELDLLMEDARGRIVGIEVKARGSVDDRDFRHLRHLASILGRRFVAGVVLYGGAETISFGANLFAMPVSAVWRLDAGS